MEDLLPYYERELAFLRRYAKEFSERYPKIAGRLLLMGDVSEDPHVERLIESFAFMGARISKKIEDDYPEFTEALLEVLYPHYLRPFPSCSIAHFDHGKTSSPLSQVVTLPRGTELLTRPVRGGPCRFRTAYDVTIAPLQIYKTQFFAIAQPPPQVTLAAQTSAQISLGIEFQAQKALETLNIQKLRIFTDGEPSLCAILRDTLALKVCKSYIEINEDGNWLPLSQNPLSPAGYAQDEALIDYPERSHPAYRLLTELFAFPEKFGFFDLDLSQVKQLGHINKLTFHVMLKDIAPDSMPARLLESLSPANVLLGCTPVVNLFHQRAEPIRVTHTAAAYPVVADARRAYAYEIHSIDRVLRIQQTPHGESIVDFRPFYSLRHGENPEQAEHYWIAHRNALVAKQSPGYEVELSIVDANFDPVLPQTDVLSIDLTCSNRDLPSQLAYGMPTGDLTLEGGSVARRITLLRKPSPSLRFEGGRGNQWRLISHLSLNHVSLVDGDATTLKEMLRLYDLSQSPISARQIEGIVHLEHRPATAWLPGRHFASMARGTEIRLTIDEDHFVGTGIHAFVNVLDRFFSLYVHANSFVRLVVFSSRSGEELMRCPARSGESPLV